MKLKNDPHRYGWKYIYDDLRKRFSDDSFPALNDTMLAGTWNHRDKNAFKFASTSHHRGPAVVSTAPAGGPFGTSQAVYNNAYAAPQSYPGSSYGAAQSSPGGAFGAPQPGPWVQHAPSHMGSGGPYASTPSTIPQLPPIVPFDPARTQVYGYGHQYASTPNTTPQLPPLASFDPEWRQNCGYGGQYASPPNTNQRLPPVASIAPEENQGDYYGGSTAMTPGMDRGSGPYQGGYSGSNDQYQHRSACGSFSKDELGWILEQGLYCSPRYGWGKITQEYLQAFNKEGVNPHDLKMAFNEMRNQRT